MEWVVGGVIVVILGGVVALKTIRSTKGTDPEDQYGA